jgi:photosystem II stability/assembly factor-like uncharacterized protein/streptogramin lyase
VRHSERYSLWLLKNSFDCVSAQNLICKLLNLGSAGRRKAAAITALVPFSTATPDFNNHSGGLQFQQMRSRRLAIFAFSLCLGIQCHAQAGQIVDMSFVDDSHGWLAVTEPSPAIFRTSDAGETWTRIPVPGFYRISFFDRQKGLAIQGVSQDEFCIYKTTNGGDSWEKVATVKHEWLHAVDLSFNGPNSAFVLGEGSGGVGWVGELGRDRALKERIDLPIDFNAQSNTLGTFGDGTGHLWIVGKELVLHSADWGRTWENQYENTSPHMDLGESGVAVPGGRAWFAAANWDIYRTTDYGRHWERALDTSEQNPIVNFSSLSFRSAMDGCAVGSSDFIFCTTDGGITWTSKKVFRTFLTGSPFWSKLKLFLSRGGWAIVAGDLYRTEDSGNSFREIFADTDVASGIPGETKALKTSINGPIGLAFYNGFLYIAEMTQERLVRVDLAHSSTKTLIAGSHNLEFSAAHELASDDRGNIWIGDFDGSLKKLDTKTGEILTVADKSVWPEMSYPSGMAFDGSGELIVSSGHNLLRWNVLQHRWEHFAGSGAGFADGPLKYAAFKFPEGVAINPRGDTYVADYENCRIRKIDHEKQIVTTIAGTGVCQSGGGDGGEAIQATMHWPSAVAVDRKNNVFFIDANRIRRIGADGVITTYAGTGDAGFGGDDGPADKALLNNPSGLAVDLEGNLYIAEYVNNRIRRVDALSRVITTVAGNGLPHRVDVIM